MFTITLATGKTFTATAVSECYMEIGGNGEHKWQVTITIADCTYPGTYYEELLTEIGALETIVAHSNEDFSSTLVGYTNLVSIDLVLNQSNVTARISLEKGE